MKKYLELHPFTLRYYAKCTAEEIKFVGIFVLEDSKIPLNTVQQNIFSQFSPLHAADVQQLLGGILELERSDYHNGKVILTWPFPLFPDLKILKAKSFIQGDSSILKIGHSQIKEQYQMCFLYPYPLHPKLFIYNINKKIQRQLFQD